MNSGLCCPRLSSAVILPRRGSCFSIYLDPRPSSNLCHRGRPCNLGVEMFTFPGAGGECGHYGSPFKSLGLRVVGLIQALVGVCNSPRVSIPKPVLWQRPCKVFPFSSLVGNREIGKTPEAEAAPVRQA